MVLHAVTDALLGAMAAGDIGQHFPDSDPRYRGVDSAVLLAEVVRLASARGYCIGNVDVTILAERPKLAPHVPAMQRRVAALLGVAAEQVGIKAKTMEGLGAIGAGDAIAALAVATLAAEPRPRPARGKRVTARSRPRRAVR